MTRLYCNVSALLLVVCVGVRWCVATRYASDESKPTNWAVLVAGSSGWMNYRHQADVCHAFQIFKKNGFPEENIIVFMYDDIANNSQNPTPGHIINRPHGPNVYEGVPHDYTGNNVTPQNFLNVLSGNCDAMRGIGSGKCVNSGPKDKIFVFFEDHGGPGMVLFPNDYLYADDLNKALKKMYDEKRFAQMVFYLGACESGSMFHKLLPNNINIYAMTAANPNQSSYACYWNNTLQTYIADLFPATWIENTRNASLAKESLEVQFKEVKKGVNLSEVCQYGDTQWVAEKLEDFFAFEEFDKNSTSAEIPTPTPTPLPAMENTPIGDDDNQSIDPENIFVRQWDVPMATLMNKVRLAADDVQRGEAKEALANEIRKRKRIDNIFGHLVMRIPVHAVPTDDIQFECLKGMVAGYERQCGKLDDYSIKYARALSNLCAFGATPQTVEDILSELCKM